MDKDWIKEAIEALRKGGDGYNDVIIRGLQKLDTTPRASEAAPAVDAGARSDVVLTTDELNTLTHQRFGNMHSMYLEGFRRLMRSAIEANATKARAALSARASEAAAGEPVAAVRDRARWFVRDFSHDVGFAMSDAQTEVMLNLFLRYSAPPAASGQKLTELLEAAEDVMRNGQQRYVIGGGDVFFGTCDSTERLQRAIDACRATDSATASDKEG